MTIASERPAAVADDTAPALQETIFTDVVRPAESTMGIPARDNNDDVKEVMNARDIGTPDAIGKAGIGETPKSSTR